MVERNIIDGDRNLDNKIFRKFVKLMNEKEFIQLEKKSY
jgi:hypothetical protein